MFAGSIDCSLLIVLSTGLRGVVLSPQLACSLVRIASLREVAGDGLLTAVSSPHVRVSLHLRFGLHDHCRYVFSFFLQRSQGSGWAASLSDIVRQILEFTGRFRRNLLMERALFKVEVMKLKNLGVWKMVEGKSQSAASTVGRAEMVRLWLVTGIFPDRLLPLSGVSDALTLGGRAITKKWLK